MNSTLTESNRTLSFLDGGGEVGALMRAHDWSRSPLGPPESWPQSLRSVVGLLLQSQFPMFVAWGDELGFLYNDSYAEILGAKHPRALGSRFYDIWSEIWADISPLIDAALAGQAVYREDLPLVMNRKGYDEQTWFTFSYSPVRDEGGRIAGMFCAVSETTRRVLAERAVRESEARLLALNETLEKRVADAVAERKLLADIVEATDIIVIVADLEHRLLAINNAAQDAFERVYGVRPKIGESMLDLLADRPEHQAHVRAVWERALKGEDFSETAEFGDPRYTRRFYEAHFRALRDYEGRLIGAYQFVQDVTERLRDEVRLQHAEDALRQAQKLESLGQLTGGVAHDFNNLLAVVSGGVQVLERIKEPEQRKRVLDGMRRAVERGSALTRHLLTFSRSRPLNPESIDLAIQITSMREMLSRSLRGDIQVVMKLSGDLWPVEVDAGEMELAILNLCVNARDAMPHGGTITISAENASDPEDGSRGEFVKLSIEDTGAGISPDILERVFEPFFTTKDVGKGSGLGLAQVYGFAKQSGGRVRVESALARGTTVTLLLPRSQSEPVPAAPMATTKHVAQEYEGGQRRQLLLVEDDAEVAALTGEMLRSIGYEVIHVTSATAALSALVDGTAIDIVLSDIMMPGTMNGLDAAREVKRLRPELPIVLMTGYAGDHVLMEREGFSLLRKPFHIDALADTLNANLKTRV